MKEFGDMSKEVEKWGMPALKNRDCAERNDYRRKESNNILEEKLLDIYALITRREVFLEYEE